MKLSILIPTIRRHTAKLERLKHQLWQQSRPYLEHIEYLIDPDETASIGLKRNRLLDRARGQYLCFIDSDDRLAEGYIDRIMEGIEKNVDCCSLKGVITTNGTHPAIFEHSLMYDSYDTNQWAEYDKGEVKYERFPNHLNCIKADVAKLFRFRDKSYGEDTDWATIVNRSGLLKTEHYISDVIYYYDYIPQKP